MTMPLGTDRIDRSGSRAVLIGVSTYQDSSFPPVPTADRSLWSMHRMLVDRDLGGWSYDQVTPIANPVDCRRVMSDLRRLAQDTSGVLLLYFVGHGTVSMNGDLVLAVSDTVAEEPDITGLEYSKIRSILLSSPAKVKAVVLDCCYSGRAIDVLAGDQQHLADITDIRGTYTLTAADRTAHAGQAGTLTAFTGELLDLIGSGVAGGPPVLTFAELYPHLRQRLIARNLPQPNQRGTDTADKCPVTRNASAQSQPRTAATGGPTGDSAIDSAGDSASPQSPTPQPEGAGPVTIRVQRSSAEQLIWSVCSAPALVGLIGAAISADDRWLLLAILLIIPPLRHLLVLAELRNVEPLVLDNEGITWRAGGPRHHIHWSSVEHIRLIDRGQSARLVVWCVPGAEAEFAQWLPYQGGYLVLYPTGLYGTWGDSVNEQLRRGLELFAGSRYSDEDNVPAR